MNKIKNLKIKVLGLLLITFIMVLIYGVNKNIASTPKESQATKKIKNLTKVEIITIKPRKLIRYTGFVGHLEPVKRISISAEIEGIIESDKIKVGSKVKKGDQLFGIETSQHQVNTNLNKSNYKLAKSNYKREKQLLKKHLSTRSKLETLKNQLEVSKYRLEKAKIIMNKSIVLAPLSGVINQKNVKKGEFARKGQKLAELINIKEVLAIINIPEKEIRFAENNKKVTLTLDAMPGKTYNGKIVTIALEANRLNRSFPVEIEINNPKRDLLPGMLARVEIKTLALKKQVLIPKSSILEDESGSYVFVLKEQKALKNRIKTGVSLGSDVQVISGLNFKEKLIVTGQQLVADDETVELVTDKK